MSTAKSMATLYLNGKRAAAANQSTATTSGIPSSTATTRVQGAAAGATGVKKSSLQTGRQLTQQRFKSSASNLAQPSARYTTTIANHHHQKQQKSRLRSTSMTNLLAPTTGDHYLSSGSSSSSRPIQRPASRNALDSIHNGMNAKYAQVQSKVAQQIIHKPAASTSSKIPASSSSAAAAAANKSATLGQPVGPRATRLGIIQPTPPSGKAAAAAGERAQLMTRVRCLEDEAANSELERESLRRELERERQEKVDQVQQLKVELQEKLAEHEKQNEEYHQKLLEAYELADQNRRAADSVLSESRQRDEESRKKIEELESQLGELREFVAMKDEMRGKLFELREQLREERERYEEQLRSLHQVFANEKISNSSLKLDENSNYFSRVKSPALLESSESINRQVASHVLAGGCRQCQSGSSQLHRSEQDMYGSKLSTRMQATAKSAWRRSKQFASSVITGSVGGLAGCRQCTSKQMGAGKRQKVTLNPRATKDANGSATSNNMSRQLTPEVATTTGSPFSARPSSSSSSPEMCGSLNHDDELQHTSVVTVNQQQQQELGVSINGTQRSQSPCPSPRLKQQQLAARRKRAEGANAGDTADLQQQQQQVVTGGSSLIHVDENNKLTIVTKFNDSDSCSHPAQQAPSSQTSSSNVSVSERSRCESSSSGRGTSSDAGDSTVASQNGDQLDSATATSEQQGKRRTPVDSALTSVVGESQATAKRQLHIESAEDGDIQQQVRRHRRKSSLFKASKMFGGSQVSLGKIKSIFTGGVSSGSKSKQQQQQQHQRELEQQTRAEHLESSRLRCLELNQAISRPSVATDCLTNGAIDAIKDKTRDDDADVDVADDVADKNKRKDSSSSEIGQGEESSECSAVAVEFKLMKQLPAAAGEQVAAS